MKTVKLFVILAAAVAAAATANAQAPGTASDNTKVNKRDRAASAVTAGQQKENRSDRELTADIRKAIVGNKDLSTYAHNVKVVTRNGMVTLKGPVRSEQEKEAVESAAKQIATPEKVKSMISVQPKS